MKIFDWLFRKKRQEDKSLPDDSFQSSDEVVKKKNSTDIKGQTIEITGEWLNQVWAKKPVQVCPDLTSSMNFLSQSKLPHIWKDVPGYIEKVNNADNPQRELRVVWTAAYLNHPNAEIIANTLKNHVTSELLTSWLVAGWLPYLIIHPNANVQNEAAKALWKCENESTIKSAFGVFSGEYPGWDSGKSALQGRFNQSAKLIVKNLREQCPSVRKKFFEEQVFEVFGPSLAEKEKTKSTGKVKFKEQEVKNKMGIKQTYEVYTANSKEDAMVFLDKTKVELQHHYVIVETPEGNWGKDIMGVFEE